MTQTRWTTTSVRMLEAEIARVQREIDERDKKIGRDVSDALLQNDLDPIQAAIDEADFYIVLLNTLINMRRPVSE